MKFATLLHLLSWEKAVIIDEILRKSTTIFRKRAHLRNKFINEAWETILSLIKIARATSKVHLVKQKPPFNVFMQRQTKIVTAPKKKYKNPSFMACYFNCCWPISTAETAVYSLAFFRVRFNQQASSFSAVYGMITLPMLPRSPPDWTPIKRRLANNGVKVHGVTSRRFVATCAALAAGDGA